MCHYYYLSMYTYYIIMYVGLSTQPTYFAYMYVYASVCRLCMSPMYVGLYSQAYVGRLMLHCAQAIASNTRICCANINLCYANAIVNVLFAYIAGPRKINPNVSNGYNQLVQLVVHHCAWLIIIIVLGGDKSVARGPDAARDPNAARGVTLCCLQCRGCRNEDYN